MKRKGVKGISRLNKKELNEKIVDVSEKEYQNRKNEKYDTTVSLVFQLTKNTYITMLLIRHIMII